MAAPIFPLKSTAYIIKKMILSTSSEVAIRSFQLEFEEGIIQAKCKGSYIYKKKNT